MRDEDSPENECDECGDFIALDDGCDHTEPPLHHHCLANLADVTFRGDRTLALMCRDPDCDKEAEVLVPGSGEPEHPREEWCRAHYEPRRKPTDCIYLLIRSAHSGEEKEGA